MSSAELKSVESSARVSKTAWSPHFLIRTGRLTLGVGLLACWYVSWYVLGPFAMASPWEVVLRIVSLARSGVLLVDTAVTMYTSVVGFLIGATFGILAPVLLIQSKRLAAAIEPYVLMSMGIPIFAMAPLLVLWFGINLTPKIILTAVTVFYIVYIATMSGLRAIDGRLISMARILGAGKTQIASEISWKSIQPFLFAGFRVAVPRAIGATIVGEFLVANRGIGSYIENARQQADVVGVFAGIVIVTVLVLGIDIILERVYARALKWRMVDPQMVT